MQVPSARLPQWDGPSTKPLFHVKHAGPAGETRGPMDHSLAHVGSNAQAPQDLNATAVAGLAGDAYELQIPGRGALRCRVPTVRDVAKLTALQFRIERGARSSDEALRQDGDAAQLEMYDVLPACLGLDPDQVRLLPTEWGRVLRDFFERSRIPEGPRLRIEPADPDAAPSAPPPSS